MNTIFLTSSPITFDNQYINEDNHLVERLKRVLKANMKALYICSDPKSYEITDKYANITKECFIHSGFTFSEFDILDGRNESDAKQLVCNAEFIILTGGHVPTQNAFFNKIHLKDLLHHSNAVILGISAGSMNMAEIVYAQPELKGEAISKEYQRFIPGLGLTQTKIIPHYQIIKNYLVDGMRMIEDIACVDSAGKEFIVLVDGSYIEIANHREIIYGESYLIKDGLLSKLCDKGAVYQLS